jgi:hypothetical protein
MKQVARNLTDVEDGFLRGSRYLLLDRDAKYTVAFHQLLAAGTVETVKLPSAEPQPERPHRAVHALHQGRVLGAVDLLR